MQIWIAVAQNQTFWDSESSDSRRHSFLRRLSVLSKIEKGELIAKWNNKCGNIKNDNVKNDNIKNGNMKMITENDNRKW